MSLLSTILFAGAVTAFAHPRGGYGGHEWKPPGPGSVRGPCPMLNTLANHGYLPRNGKNLTQDVTLDGLAEALNLDNTFVQPIFNRALTTNPEPNATWFSLENLNTHNILEHDASLSRVDAYFGNPQPFNQTIFDQTRSYWTDPHIINVQMAANARSARVATSKATNPTYSMSTIGEIFSVGESAAYILVISGDNTTGTVRKSWVEYVFEHERLPFELGWRRPKNQITRIDLVNMMARVTNATAPDDSTVAIRDSFHTV
ncbi:Cloroperoxidase [Thozetella sp. PMI_491]|nr:Cloroperoxidase [Thozetella sp. PMI_491]